MLLSAFTSNLSMFGCFVITGTPFSEGTRVSLRIMRSGTTFAASGNVVYSKPNYGMGIAFREIDPGSLTTLGEWIEVATLAAIRHQNPR
jgi:hypothetical protein